MPRTAARKVVKVFKLKAKDRASMVAVNRMLAVANAKLAKAEAIVDALNHRKIRLESSIEDRYYDDDYCYASQYVEVTESEIVFFNATPAYFKAEAKKSLD